jgi:hypothetical protein
MSEEEIVSELVPLWGKKLGSDRSKEPRSAKWVLDALSDFNGQIQSRDLIRLLFVAASNSISDTKWQDRLLVPTEIRKALTKCSQEKISEISVENKVLSPLLDKLGELPQTQKKSPFTREDMPSLSSEELKTLEDNGVIIRDGDNYYVSEIFRLGLGFSQNAGPSRILYLARLARSRFANSGY